MAKRKSPTSQIDAKALPEYGELISIMQDETASIVTDYIRQYVGILSKTPEPGSGIFLNWDRVLRTQTYQELAWYELYQEVERDPQISAVLSSAKLNVASMRWDVSPYVESGQSKPSARNEAIARFVDDNAPRMQEWLDQIAEQQGPEKAFNCVKDLLEYHVPKLARTELTGKDGGAITIKASSEDENL